MTNIIDETSAEEAKAPIIEKDSPTDRPYISVSRINSYSMCGYAFKRRYVDHDIRPSGLSMHKGSAFHSMAQENNTKKKDSKSDLAQDYLQDFIAQDIEKRFAEGVMLSSEERTRGKAAILGESKDILVSTVEQFVQNNTLIQPREVEQKQRLVLNNFSKDLVYMMDLETVEDDIRDMKFSAKKKNQNDVDSSLQLTGYAMAFFSKYGRMPHSVVYDNYGGYITPAKQELKTFYNPLVSNRTKDDFQVFVNRMVETIKALDAGIFLPAPAGHWKCGERYCEYASDCVFFNSRGGANASE